MSARPSFPKYALWLRCEAPLHHGAFGEDVGNAVALRRLPLIGHSARGGVPVLSGNAIRGNLRRAVMRDLFERVGLSRDTVPGKQWDKLYAALANGGHLTAAETRVDPSARLALRAAVPPLSVFGAALYSYLLPGRVAIGWAYAYCQETVAAGVLPDGAPALTVVPDADQLVVEITLTRHVEREQQDPALSGVTPMPVTVEALAPGTWLGATIVPQDRCTGVELGVIAHGLDLVRAVGGKVGVGFGRLTVEHGLDAEPYRRWLDDAAATARCRDALLALAEGMA